MLKLVTENLQNYLCRELRTKSLNSDLSYPSEIENIFTASRIVLPLANELLIDVFFTLQGNTVQMHRAASGVACTCILEQAVGPKPALSKLFRNVYDIITQFLVFL